MSTRVLKFIISAGLWMVDRLRAVVRCLLGRQAISTYVILYYHSVAADQRARFSRQMKILVRMTTPVQLGVPFQPNPGARYSSVTFDDVFANVLEYALPEMQALRIPATFFVATGRLGQKADWWPEGKAERHERLVSEAELRRLPEPMVTIGSHGVSHAVFPSLTEASARRELVESREMLERSLQRKIESFSFPYGAFNEKSIDLCREAGYTRVYTTVPVLASAQERFVTGRICADPSDWAGEFRLKLLGAYRWLPYAFWLKRRMRSALQRVGRGFGSGRTGA
jgi:peptidoglycan/xylan/chitin deacetylase (PgdA/CDA1 family)